MIRKTIVITGIIFTGIFIAVAVTISQPKNVLGENDVNWSKDVGGVSAAPACVSASVSANATCDSSGNASITFSWSEVSGSCHYTDSGTIVNAPDVSINISGGSDRRTDTSLPCTFSKTYSGLIQGTTYSYSIYNQYNWHSRNITAPWPVINGSFTVPNCTPTTPTPTPTPTPTSAPAWPTVTASCPDPGTSAVLSWNRTTGSDHFEIGVNDTTTGSAWPGTPGDLAISNYRTTSYSFATVYGHTYNAWVSPCTASGVCGTPPAPYITFTCPTTTYVPPPVYSCGRLPVYAVGYPGDEIITSYTEWVYSARNTSRKCEYQCMAGYVWSVARSQCIVKPPPSKCNDKIDNDGDGLIDYPADPGCISPDDNDETDGSDTLSATNCEILNGASKCTSTVSWSTTVSSSTAELYVKQDRLILLTLASWQLKSSKLTQISYGDTRFALSIGSYYDSTELIHHIANAKCTAGTVWNGSICTTGTPSPTPTTPVSGDLKINGSDSDITLPSGNTVTAIWTTSGGTSCSVAGDSVVWSGTSGTQSQTLSTTHTYVLSCDGIALDAVKVTIVDSPKLTTPRRTVTKGDKTTLNWNVGKNDPKTCSITGGSLGSSYSILSSTSTTGYIDVVVNANTTYTLTCSSGGSSSVTIEVMPKGFET